MYKNYGYEVYQTVNKYYSGGTKSEDAYGKNIWWSDKLIIL